MKRIEELTLDECQTFLDQMFDNSVEFNKIIFENDCIDGCGLEYRVKSHDHLGFIPFSHPEFMIWLYANDVDMTFPLKQLRFDYNELDETNSILFEYAMTVNQILEDVSSKGFDAIYEMENSLDKDAIRKIKIVQRDLISKL